MSWLTLVALLFLLFVLLAETAAHVHRTTASTAAPRCATICCPGGGVYFWWQIGAMHELLSMYDLPDDVKLSGASAGARVRGGGDGGVARWLVARRVGHRVGHRVSLHRLGVACRRRREDGGGAGDETRPRRRRRGGEGDSRVAPPGDDDARGRRVAALEVAQETGVHAERAAVVAARRRVGDIGGRGGGARSASVRFFV